MSAVLATFLFALASSLHCAGMCGPLALCATGSRGAVPYHAARVLAYVALGALAGALGEAAVPRALAASGAALPLLLGACLLLFAAFGAHAIGRVPGLGRALQRGHAWAARLGPTARGAVLGALTPLLPCGLLWAGLAAAVVAGTWHAGALAMLGFALGSLPALALVQLPFAWSRLLRAPAARQRVRRVALLAAAAVLLWRGGAAFLDEGCCDHASARATPIAAR